MTTEPTDVQRLMQACQRGVAGKGPAIEAANNLLAECYGLLGKLAAENEALRKDAERWKFFKELSCQIQAFPHAWGQMTPEKMDFMCDEAMTKEAQL